MSKENNLDSEIEKFRKTGNFKLRSGKYSDHYFDVKEMMGNPKYLSKFVQVIRSQHQFDNKGMDVIIGLEFGGISLAVALSIDTGIPYAILRKKSHGHGMKKRIEGFQKPGRALVVDDVKTTGKSFYDAIQYLESSGYEIIGEATVVDRSDDNE